MDFAADLPGLEALRRRGFRVRALERRPRIREHLQDIWEAFWNICGSRPPAEGLWPVPVSEILAYFDLVGLDAERRRDWFDALRALDVEWLGRMRAARREAVNG